MAYQEGYFPRNRAERVISVGRLFLAVFLLLAVALDPTEPGVNASLVRKLALAYVVYSAAVAALVWERLAATSTLAIVTHAVDLVVFSAFMHLTDSIDSPFFVYFVFATLCGAMRWHGRGALLTGGAVLAVYVAIAIGDLAFRRPGEFEVARFIARCTQLAIVTGLLAYLGTYQRRLQHEIGVLAEWPRHLPVLDSLGLQEVIAYSAKLLRVRRAMLVWEEGDEPSVRIASSTGQRIELARASPDAFGSIVAGPFSQSSFLCTDASAALPQVLKRTAAAFTVCRGAPLDPRFRDRFNVRGVVAVRLTSESIKGWLFALDRADVSADDLLLGDIVGRLVADALELSALVEQLRDTAAAEERLRLARELHDGVLQSLTAASLEAGRARHAVARDPSEAQRRLSKLEDTIRAEHQALRTAIADMKPAPIAGALAHDWAERVREAAGQVAGQWNARLRLDMQAMVPPVSLRTSHELVRMVQESIANAVRHGGAKEIRVTVAASPDDVRVVVAYDGRGFKGFNGRHDLASLNAMKAGPWSLKERVSALSGSLVIDSTEEGACVEIAVPVTSER
jgi:signal transduction histidine kinase